MNEQKPKSGVTVKEIESFTKKHRFEVFLSVSLVFSCFFSFVFFDGWIPVLGAVGGILGAVFPQKAAVLMERFSRFFQKQEELTQWILIIAGIVLAVFIPILTFFILGAAGGKYLEQLRDSISPKEK
jgi:hypothetical protein